MRTDEVPLLNEPNIMLVALKTARQSPALPDDCVRALTATLQRISRDEDILDPADIRYRVAVAFHHLCVAGLLDPDEEGRCTITPRGLAVLLEHPDGVDPSVLVEFPEYRSFIRRSPPYEVQDDAGSRAEEPRAEYDQGYDAYRAGLDLSENPYETDTVAHLEWENGWSEASSDTAEGNRPYSAYEGQN